MESSCRVLAPNRPMRWAPVTLCPYENHLVRRDLASGHPGDLGVLPAALDVAQEAVARVLQLLEPIL
eukprot:643053-Pyramimonas_sp.AAC.1